jgi:hypothetical protein
MGVGAALIALRSVDLLTLERQEILDSASEGPAPPGVVAAAGDERTKAYQVDVGADPAARRRHGRELRALGSFLAAIDEPEWPSNAGDPLYEAAKALEDPWETAEIEAMQLAILGPARAAAAQEIDTASAPDGLRAGGGDRDPFIGTLQPSPGHLVWVIGTSFLAGAAASLGADAAATWLPGSPPSIGFVVFSLVAVPILVLGVRLGGTKPDDSDVWAAAAITFAALVTGRLLEPVMSSLDTSFVTTAVTYGLATVIGSVGVYAVLRASALRPPLRIGDATPRRTAPDPIVRQGPSSSRGHGPDRLAQPAIVRDRGRRRHPAPQSPPRDRP